MKSKTILFFLLSTRMSLNASAQNSTSIIGGKAIFENNCVRCHGNDGTKGAFGAKNLRKSQLDDPGLFKIIFNGKWIMPRWGKKLSPEQIQQVINYIKTLRN